MDDKLCCSNDAIVQSLEKYADLVHRICYIYLHNQSDAEDVFQDVFLKLFQSGIQFESEKHKKAWICRVTINRCKDLCKSFFRSRTCSLEEVETAAFNQVESDVMNAVLSLPPKLKDTIYLFYYENYTVPEISKMLEEKENTVYSHLHRARKLLKRKLGGYEHEQLL